MVRTFMIKTSQIQNIFNLLLQLWVVGQVLSEINKQTSKEPL